MTTINAADKQFAAEIRKAIKTQISRCIGTPDVLEIFDRAVAPLIGMVPEQISALELSREQIEEVLAFKTAKEAK